MKGPAPEGATVVLFPALAEAVHDHPAYEEALRGRDLPEEPLRGTAVAGPRRWVRSLTGTFRLLR
jgi:hypothetical protein